MKYLNISLSLSLWMNDNDIGREQDMDFIWSVDCGEHKKSVLFVLSTVHIDSDNILIQCSEERQCVKLDSNRDSQTEQRSFL